MARENEGQTLRDYGNRKKRYRRIRTFIICMLLLAIVAMGIVYWFRISNMSYHGYEVTNSTPNTGEFTSGYISYGSSVVKYSKDGAVAIDKDGDLLWNGSYEMMDPIADTCGDYVVVADRGSKSLHIYNNKGEVGSILTLYDIVQVKISKQGVVAALMQEGETSYIKFYYADSSVVTSSEESNVLCEIETNVNEDGYPMDIALSEDGEKLIVIFLTVTSGELVSSIGFYNFGEVGQSHVDRITGVYIYKGNILPKAIFLNNDVACVYKEDGFMLYSVPEIPKLIHQEDLKQKVQSVLHSEKYTGVVLAGEEGTARQLLLYDLKGNKILDRALDFDYDKIFLAGEDIIMYDNLSCLIIKTNGEEKFRYTFTGNVAAFYPINNLNQYFYINASDISEITLVE